MDDSSSSGSEDSLTTKRTWREYLKEEVTRDWTDLVLLVGCFATGLLDAAVFNVWSCFVSMQTGNTVYVGLGITSQPYSQPYRWVKSGTSVLSFILGSFLFSRLSSSLSPLRRSTLILTSTLQALLILISALLSQLDIVPRGAGDLVPDNLIVLLPLSLLAMAAGGQCVLSRVLGYNEVPTVVLTSAYCDLVMDEKVFSGVTGNSKRNRRAMSAMLLLGGAAIGGWMTKEQKIEGALWIVGGVKVGMALLWVGWKAEGRGIRLA